MLSISGKLSFTFQIFLGNDYANRIYFCFGNTNCLKHWKISNTLSFFLALRSVNRLSCLVALTNRNEVRMEKRRLSDSIVFLFAHRFSLFGFEGFHWKLLFFQGFDGVFLVLQGFWNNFIKLWWIPWKFQEFLWNSLQSSYIDSATSPFHSVPVWMVFGWNRVGLKKWYRWNGSVKWNSNVMFSGEECCFIDFVRRNS